MKRAIALLLISGALANASTVLLPLGPWPICESSVAPSVGMICAGFVPGHEMYLLAMEF